MKILGIESSSDTVSVALSIDGAIIQCAVDGGATPSEGLIPAIMQMLKDQHVRLGELDAIALGVGPGMFTALRLGCSVAQGLALASGLKIIPVCSLDVIAAATQARNVFVAIDARMGEVYFAGYETTHERPEPLLSPRCLPPEAIHLPEGKWIGVGSGFASYPDRLLPHADGLIERRGDVRPRAADLVRLGALRGVSDAENPEDIGPLYVRDKVALTVAERVARGGRA